MNYYKEYLKKYYKEQLLRSLIAFWCFCISSGLLLGISIICSSLLPFLLYIMWNVLNIIIVIDIKRWNQFLENIDNEFGPD